MSNWTVIEITCRGKVEPDSNLGQILDALEYAEIIWKEGALNPSLEWHTRYENYLKEAAPFGFVGSEGPIYGLHLFDTCDLVCIRGSLRDLNLKDIEGQLRECVSFLEKEGMTDIRVLAYDNEGELRIGF